MNENLKLLYDTLKEQGLYTKSFEEFVAKYEASPGGQQKIFEEVAKRGLYTKTRQEFKDKYFPVKKKDEPTDLLLESGLSGRSGLTIEDIEATENLPEATPEQPDFSSYGEQEEPFDYQAVSRAFADAPPIDEPQPDIYGSPEERLAAQNQSLDRLGDRYRQEQSEQKKREMFEETKRNYSDFYKPVEEMANTFITPELMGMEEEKVVPQLRERFGQYGFNFVQAGGGDAMKVINHDGTQNIDIDLDAFTNTTEVAESDRLREFIKQYAYQDGRERMPEEVAEANYANQSLRAKQMRPVARKNSDGSLSTHLMMSFEEDGVYKVVPTLFPREGFVTNLNSETWLELTGDEAIEEARKRSEIFTFATEEEANDFAEGGWKSVSTVDAEGEQFFNDRGGNYHAFQQARDRYSSVLDERDFLKEAVSEGLTYDELTDREKELYGDYFYEDGRVDVGEAEMVADELTNKAEELVDIVGDSELLTMEEDFDVYLEGQRQQKAQEAATINQAANQQAANLNEQSMRVLGVGIEDLPTFTPKTTREYEVYNQIIGEYLDVLAVKDEAALQYELSNLYLDAKQNKAVQRDFVENIEGFQKEWSDGLKTGNAAEIILRMSPVGQAMGFDTIDMEDDQAVAAAVAELIAINESKDGRMARGLTRFNNSRTDREMYRALRNDPLEVSLQWMGASLAQILPYGTKILAGTTAAGAGIGAVYGGTATAGTGALPGAVIGAGYGIRLGMSINSFVLEYTNGILDAVAANGYDASDPDQMVAALNDPKVWAEGQERGAKRGLTIAAMDYISGGLAGKVFKPARAASKATKAANFVAQRATFDPAMEALGEAAAMTAVGDELDLKEIIAEAGGAFGNQTINASMNIAKSTLGNNNQRIANELMDVVKMAEDGSSDTQIQRWTDNMTRLGKITAEQGQRILENMALRREANDLLEVTSPSGSIGRALDGKTKERTRLMELMAVREGLSSTSNRAEVFRGTIKAINEEIRMIAETGKIPEAPINLDALNIVGFSRQGVASYRVGKQYMTKEEFVSYVESAGPLALRRLQRNSQVKNDPETSALLVEKINAEPTVAEAAADANTDIQTTVVEEDAIQEPSTEEVPTREPSGDSAEVGEGVPESGETTQPIEAQDEAAEATVEEEAQVEVIDRPVRSDVTAFRNGTIDPARLDGIVAGIEARQTAGKKLTKFQQEVLSSQEQDVAAEADALSEELAVDEGLFAPPVEAVEEAAVEEVAPEPVAEGEMDVDIMTLNINAREREVSEAKGKYKRERAKIKRRVDSPAKTAALETLKEQEAAEIEAIQEERKIFLASRNVKQGKPLPKFFRPDGRTPATPEQLQRIATLAGVDVESISPTPEAEVVEETAPAVVEETATQEEIALTDPLAELYFKWLRRMRSAEIEAIEEKEPSNRTRSERAKLAAVGRALTKATKAADKRGLSTSEQIALQRRVDKVVLAESEAAEATVEETQPAAEVAVDETTATAEAGVQTPAPEQTNTEIEAELLASRQEGNTVEEIQAEQFPLQESDFVSQEAYGRAINKWSAGKARRLAAMQEQETRRSPEERASADKERMMAPIRAGRFAVFGNRNGLEAFTMTGTKVMPPGVDANFDPMALDIQRGREQKTTFKEKQVDGVYYYTLYEEGSVLDTGNRPGYIATTFISATPLDRAQKALIKEALAEKNKYVIETLPSAAGGAIGRQKVPAGYTTPTRVLKYDQATSPTRQFMLEATTDGSLATSEEVQQAIDLMNEVSPELAENDFDVEAPTMATVPILVTENQELVAKIVRMPLSELVGQDINLAMADQLKVDSQRMGGPFFPLQEGVFGKAAWASIDEASAKKIIIGAAKGNYTLVYNMKPSALDSNIVTMRYAMELIQQQENSQQLFDESLKYLRGRKYGSAAKNKQVQDATDVQTMEEFITNLEKLSTDLRADILRNLFPTDQVKSKVDIHISLKEIGATMENIRKANIEQFTNDLPMGALTMVLEVTDAEGNKVTEESLGKNGKNYRDFLMTPEQQEAEGVPRHTNYDFYIRGRAVALLEDTVPFWNVTPEALAMIDSKAAQQTMQRDQYKVTDKDGKKLDVRTQKMPDGTTRVELYNNRGLPIAGTEVFTEVKDVEGFVRRNYGKIDSFQAGRPIVASEAKAQAMRSAMMTAGTPSTTAAPVATQYEQFVNRLSAAFPSVEVVTNQEQFDTLMADANANALTTKDQKVYGVVVDGKVYLNPALENYNTPIHEFGHIWLNTAKELNPEAYQRGMELVEDSPYMEQVRNSRNYKRVIKAMRENGATEAEIDAYTREEALAIAIGNKGESFTSAAQKRNFKAWLQDLFNFIKELTGISDITSEQLQDMTLDEFTQAVVVDLLSENELFAEAEQVGLSETMQFMTGTDNASMSMRDVIRVGREKGYSDASIKKLLTDRGYQAKEVNEALAEYYDLLTQVPSEFGNVEGGMSVGKRIFEDVRNEVKRFANSRSNPTRGQVRAKALEALRANPVYQSQSAQVQEELASALDRSLQISANRNITQEISALRNNIRQRRKGAQSLQEAKRALSQFIRANMPKSGIYSQAQINRLVNRVAKATESSLLADMEYVLGQVEIQNEKIKKQLIKQLMNEVTKDSKKGKSSAGTGKKARRGRLGADAQAFAAELKRVLDAATIADPIKRQAALDALNAKLETEESVNALAKYIEQGFDGLTTKERRVVLQALALQNFADISNMPLEEVAQLVKEYKEGQLAERTILAATRAARAEANSEINETISAQLKDMFPDLFNEDGTPMNRNDRRRKMDEMGRLWRSGKGKGLSERTRGMVLASKEFLTRFKVSDTKEILLSVINSLKHLGTFMNTLGPEMKRQVYDRLNKAETRYLKGFFEQTENKMDALAQEFGFESYEALSRELYSSPTLTIDYNPIDNPKRRSTEEFDKDQILRLYSLSKNPVQRDKLRRMGMDFDDPTFAAEIESYLGTELMGFADATVDYLSNEYYESVNNVYREVNDVNLNYISNYFPTRTIGKVDADLLADGDFNAIFDAEFASGLKERSDTDSEIEMKGASFTTALNDHYRSMERFKAYAADTRTLNSIINNESVLNVMDMLRMTGAVRQSINQAINPDSAKQAMYDNRALSWMQTAYTGVALAFKAVQILKQATSAIQAFPDYTYLKSGKRMPGLDLLLWTADFAAVMAQPRKYMRIAREMSPQFKYRLKMGMKGDVVGLEGGVPTRGRINQRGGFLGRGARLYARASAAPTIIGDIMGVLGYMANFRRDVINGMAPEQAIQKFEDYNETQQSRRATERSIIQQNANAYTRLFTMFGSASLLMINNVSQSGLNIARAIGKGKAPSMKDVRKFYVNYGLANALFVGASNFGKLWAGDDEDKREAYRKILMASAGINLLSFIPILGGTAENAIDKWMRGEKVRVGDDIGAVNPLSQVSRRFRKVKTDEDRMIAAGLTIADYALRANVDTFAGMLNFIAEKSENPNAAVEDMESFYEAIGVTPSYRPRKFTEGELSEYGKRIRDKKERDKERRESRETEAQKERKRRQKEREDRRKFKRQPKR